MPSNGTPTSSPAADFGKPLKPADPVAPKLEPGQKWIFTFANFAKDDTTEAVSRLVKDGHKAGYNGILVSNVKFERLQLTDNKFKERLQAFRKVCKDEGMKLAVSVGGYGYSEFFLTHDRNLAEGMPVRDATFIVKDGKLVPFDETTKLVNGSFEDIKNGLPVGWEIDNTSTVYKIDDTTKTDGKVSLCMKESKKGVRAWQKVKLQPWHYYIVSAMCKNDGWDDPCVKSGKMPGQLLADAAVKFTAIIKKVDPGKPIATWNDMFDPYHNASPTAKHYYLVKGDGPWAGSWEGLSRDVIIFNWAGNKQKNLDFFAQRGHQQILAGYYDADPKRIIAWLEMGKDQPGVVGVMYTTWVGDFSKLEEFAKGADSAGKK